MSNHPEQSGPKTETAIDLSEEERTALFGAAMRLLKTHGTVLYPNPDTTYINSDRQQYTPKPTMEAEISADELHSDFLPDGKIKVEADEINFGEEGPKQLAIGTERLATRVIAGEDGQPDTFAYGTETAWVVMSRDDQFGLVIEDEGGDGSFMMGSEDVVSYTEATVTGERVELRGKGPLYMDNAPTLSRQEWIDITTALSSVQ